MSSGFGLILSFSIINEFGNPSFTNPIKEHELVGKKGILTLDRVEERGEIYPSTVLKV